MKQKVLLKHLYNHRLIVSYKGTNYFGWQDLGESVQKPTIEAKIHQVLKKICNYQDCTIAVASRTDAGVHAQGQVLKVTIELDINSKKLLLGMNSLLPDDIRVLQCQPCLTQFNPNKHSKSKEYHYYFYKNTVSNPILSDIMFTIPFLDITLMNEACKLFIGRHDFYSFAKQDKNMNSCFRTVISCEILQVPDSTFTSSTYYLKIVGEGFLRYMVRYIVGALFALVEKKISLSDISEALKNHNEKKLTSKAKSKALHLIEVSY